MEGKRPATRFETLQPGDKFFMPPDPSCYMKIEYCEFKCPRSTYKINAIELSHFRVCYVEDDLRGIVKKDF